MAAEIPNKRLIRYVSDADQIRLEKDFIGSIRRRALQKPIAQWVLAEVIVLCSACESQGRIDSKDHLRRGNAIVHGALIHIRNFTRLEDGSFTTRCPNDHTVNIQSLPATTSLIVDIHLDQVAATKTAHPAGLAMNSSVSAA